MTMEVRVLSPENAIWEACLTQTPHDFYHWPRYVATCAEHEDGQPCALLAEEGPHRLFLPLILRPITCPGEASSQLYDATSAYGYPSPLLWKVGQPRLSDNVHAQAIVDVSLERFMERALEAMRRELLTRGVVSLFVRFHPLLSLPLEPFRRQGTIVRHGETVYIDLNLSEEEQWNQMRPPYRNRIRRALRNGLAAEIDAAWDSFDDFFEIYTDTMRRVQASQYYFFPRQYLVELRDALRGNLHLVSVPIQGEMASAGLFSEVDGIVQLHLTGNRVEYTEHHTSKLLIDSVRRWAKERGNRLFHLGGGLGAQDDSLLYFKAGFSRLRANYHTWRAVVHAEAYEELVRQWQQLAGLEASGPNEFFPAYRKPLPHKTDPGRIPLPVAAHLRTSSS